MTEKTPMVRFLFEEARRKERAAEDAKKREDDAKASRKLQEEVEKLASTLWAGRDDHTAGLLREGIKAMQERDKLRLKADLYDEVTYYLTRCGYGYPSAVENMPTATQMAEHALNHRSAIQGFLERALEHLGVPEKWLVRVRDGQMGAFFEAFGVAEAPPEQEAPFPEHQAFADVTGALNEVRRKLCRAAGVDGDTSWETLVPAVEQLSTECDHWKGAHESASEENMISARHIEEYQAKIFKLEQDNGRLSRASEERESILMALKTVRDIIVESDALIAEALGGTPTKDAEYASDLLDNVRALITRLEDERETWGTERGSLKAEIARLNKEVANYRQGDETLAGSWKGHVLRIASALGAPRVVMGQATNPNVDEIMKFINQNVLPMVEVSKRVEAIEQRLSPQATCPHCGARHPAGTAFCPRCGKEETEPAKGPHHEEEAVFADPKFAMRNKEPGQS